MLTLTREIEINTERAIKEVLDIMEIQRKENAEFTEKINTYFSEMNHGYKRLEKMVEEIHHAVTGGTV